MKIKLLVILFLTLFSSLAYSCPKCCHRTFDQCLRKAYGSYKKEMQCIKYFKNCFESWVKIFEKRQMNRKKKNLRIFTYLRREINSVEKIRKCKIKRKSKKHFYPLNCFGQNSFYQAARYQNVKLLKKFILQDAKSFSKEIKKGDIAFEALSCWENINFYPIIKTLVSYGLDANTKNKVGQNMLFHIQNDYKTAMFLVQKGAKIHVIDNDGQNILHYSLSIDLKNDLRWIKYLLDQGIDPLKKNSMGETPFQLAKYTGNKKLIELFKKYIKK